MDLSKAIRVLMEERDLRVLDVLSATGWGEAYVSQCRNGKANPSGRLAEWAEVLGVQASELVRRAESYPDPVSESQKAA